MALHSERELQRCHIVAMARWTSSSAAARDMCALANAAFFTAAARSVPIWSVLRRAKLLGGSFACWRVVLHCWASLRLERVVDAAHFRTSSVEHGHATQWSGRVSMRADGRLSTLRCHIAAFVTVWHCVLGLLGAGRCSRRAVAGSNCRLLRTSGLCSFEPTKGAATASATAAASLTATTAATAASTASASDSGSS